MVQQYVPTMIPCGRRWNIKLSNFRATNAWDIWLDSSMKYAAFKTGENQMSYIYVKEYIKKYSWECKLFNDVLWVNTCYFLNRTYGWYYKRWGIILYMEICKVNSFRAFVVFVNHIILFTIVKKSNMGHIFWKYNAKSIFKDRVEEAKQWWCQR